jgi:toxin ParE1/3/4
MLRWGEAQSGEYLSKLRHAMVLLAGSPQIGMQRPELGLGILSFPLTSHIIYYQVDKKDVVVFAVLHKAMVPSRHLEDRKFP